MAEANRPEKLVIGELSKELKEKTLRALFMKYGQIVDVILNNDRETNKSRRRCNNGGTSIEDPAGVKGAGAEGGNVHGKLSDGKARVELGKATRVEHATKAAFGGGRLEPPPPPPRCTGPPRGRGRGRDGKRGSRRLPTHVADGSSSVKY